MDLAKEILSGLEGFAGIDELFAGGLDLFELFFEQLDHGAVLTSTERVEEMLGAVVFTLDIFEEVVAAVEELGEFVAVLLKRGRRSELEIGTEAAQEACVDGVGFGEDAQGLRIAAHAQGLSEADEASGLEGGAEQSAFVAAAGFADEADALGVGMGSEFFKELKAGFWGVFETEDGVKKIENEFVFSDIDAEVNGRHWRRVVELF